MNDGCPAENPHRVSATTATREGGAMHTIKVNIHGERRRFIKLYHAMMKCEQVEGCYVMEYMWVKEQGGTFAKFTLCEADDIRTLF